MMDPRQLKYRLRQALLLSQRRLRPGLRTLVGILTVIGGLFGFLPILGFWMIPLGIVIIASDLPPLRRYLRARLRR